MCLDCLFRARKHHFSTEAIKFFFQKFSSPLFLLHFYPQPLIQRLMKAYRDSDHLRSFWRSAEVAHETLLYCYGARVRLLCHRSGLRNNTRYVSGLFTAWSSNESSGPRQHISFSVCGGITVKDLPAVMEQNLNLLGVEVMFNPAFFTSILSLCCYYWDMWLRSALYYILEILRGYWNACQCLSCS